MRFGQLIIHVDIHASLEARGWVRTLVDQAKNLVRKVFGRPQGPVHGGTVDLSQQLRRRSL